MMWANPLALLCLLSIVVLLLARRLRPRRRVAVGNLYLWSQDSEARHTAVATRLRRHRLLIYEVALVIALCVALARPFFASSGDVAFVLDVSMSMGANDGSTTALDRAKTGMMDMIARLPRRTRVQLWVSGHEPRHVGEYGRGDIALPDAIRNIRAWDTGGDLQGTVRRTRSPDNVPSRIYVWTDRPIDDLGSDVELFAVGHAANNVALTDLAVRRRPDGRGMELLVGATNFGQHSIQTQVIIGRGQQEIARRPLSLAPRGSGALVFPVPDSSAVISARLALTDALAADDTRRIALAAGADLRVLLLVDNVYIQQALATLPDVVVDSGPSAAAASGNYDIVVCDRCGEVGSRVQGANVLAVPPAEAAAHPSARVVLENDAHPVARALADHTWTARPVRRSFLPPDATVIARTADQPVVVASDSGTRRVLELRLDLRDPVFVVEPAFPLLIANAVEWLRTSRDGATLVAGEPAPWTDDRERWLTDTATAGVYELPAGSSVRRLVVNPDVNAESDLATIDSSREGSGGGNASVMFAETLYADGTVWALFAALALLAGEWHQRTPRGGAR
jgi:hypothetical protein